MLGLYCRAHRLLGRSHAGQRSFFVLPPLWTALSGQLNHTRLFCTTWSVDCPTRTRDSPSFFPTPPVLAAPVCAASGQAPLPRLERAPPACMCLGAAPGAATTLARAPQQPCPKQAYPTGLAETLDRFSTAWPPLRLAASVCDPGCSGMRAGGGG